MFTNLPALKRAHRGLIRDTERAIERNLDDAGDHAKKHVAMRATFKHRTGRTKRATSHRIIRRRNGMILRIKNTSPVARILEHGSRPHIIRARRKKALRFFWIRVSKMMNVRSVRHPGTKPYWFLRAAARSAHGRAGLGLRRAMTDIARQF